MIPADVSLFGEQSERCSLLPEKGRYDSYTLIGVS